MTIFSWKRLIIGNRWSYLPTRVLPIQSKTYNNYDFNLPSNEEKANDGGQNRPFLNHFDIKQKAIQVLYTDDAPGHKDEHQRNRPCYCRVIHPNKPFRRIFDLMTVAWVLYLVFFIPLEIGFSWFTESSRQKKLMNFLDFWFAVDFILNFRTGYIYHGTIIMDQNRIIWNYLRTWFTVDFLGTFPFERLINSKSTSRKSLKLIKYFKIPKLLRISRVLKYIRVHRHVYDIVQVLVLVLTCLHVGACIWMTILNPCVEISDNYSGKVLCSQDKIYSLYAEAFHLSTTMLLGVSNMHVISNSSIMDMLTRRREEDRCLMYVISTVFMIGGLILTSLLIGEMTAYLMGVMQGSAAFQRKIDRVNHEMEYYAVPDNLQRQVRAFYDYVWIHQKQYDHKIALLSDDNMSTDLQRKLALHLYKDVVSHISIFSDIDDLLLGEICMSLRTRIFLPCDMIIFKGDIGKELFIISKGVVEVLRDDLPPEKQLHATPIMLHSGSFFGEIALIMEVRRTCSVQARTICEINLLEQKAFDSILRDNPEFSKRMNELVVVRQLERAMTKNSQKGIDYQISKDDYDRAFVAVSRQMKEGLDRRMKSSNSEVIRPRERKNMSDVIGNNTSCNHCHSADFSDDEDSSPSISRSRFDKLQDNKDISQMMTDITRRSTRFTNENIREPTKCVSTKGIASCSDGEVDLGYNNSSVAENANISNNFEGKRRRKSMQEFTRDSNRVDLREAHTSISGKEIDAIQAAGHFNPEKTIVDIKKVHASILQKGSNDSKHTTCEGKIKVLGARFEVQDAFFNKLWRKLERIETWLCGSSIQGQGNDRNPERDESDKIEPTIT